MTLYEINSELESAFNAAVDPDTGEILDADKLEAFEQLQMVQEEKIENIACFIKNLKSDAAALKAEEQALSKRRKFAENKAEWLSKYLSDCLNGKTYKSARAAISYRKSVSVDIADIESIPEQYRKITIEPNKTEIKNALKNGEEIPGATLVEKSNMVIK